MTEEKSPEGKRRLEDWLLSYLDYTEIQESPDIFHQWCGISVIAATLERSVWMDKFFYKVYPNLYVVLVAKSASARKSTAIGIAEKLLRGAVPDLRFLTQKMTTESMMDQMKDDVVSAGYILSDELSVTLGRSLQDAQFIKDLTKMYDCGPFDYGTIGRGIQSCNNVCLNILGGTTTNWVKQSLPEGAIGGGFTSRIIFVHQKGSGKREAFPEDKVTPALFRLRDDLIHDLTLMRELEGEFKITPKGKGWYKDWYESIFDQSSEETSLDGYMGRKHTTVLKLSMALSASRGDSLIVTEEDLDVALRAINANEGELPDVMHSIQRSVGSVKGEKILNRLRVLQGKSMDGWVPYSDFLRGVAWLVEDAEEFKRMLGTLCDSTMVEMRRSDKGHPIYRLARKGKE